MLNIRPTPTYYLPDKGMQLQINNRPTYCLPTRQGVATSH